MKRAAFYLFITALLYSCTGSKYKIEGKTESTTLNGQTIFLKERINREWISIDSTKIENGTFKFEGTCDSARVAYLYVELPSGEKLRQPFIFENGNINVMVDSLGYVFSGTVQNELLQSYQDEKTNFYKKAEAIYNQSNDSNATTAQKAELTKKLTELAKEEVSIDLKFCSENVNSIAGTHVFMSTYYAMSIEEKESVIKKMNAETLKINRIQEIIAGIEIEKKTAKGSRFIDLKLPGLNGDSIALSELIGKTDYVLIDFWASWCGPCMQSLPELKDLYNTYKGQKLEILGVSLDDDQEAWKSTINSKELTWKHISDLQGWKSAGAKTYAISSIPATVLINKKGIIEGRNLSFEELKMIISKSVE